LFEWIFTQVLWGERDFGFLEDPVAPFRETLFRETASKWTEGKATDASIRARYPDSFPGGV